jgi:hypothetical protein
MHQELLEKQYKRFTWGVTNCGENREHCVSKKCGIFNSVKVQFILGHAMAQFVEALRYKPDGCGFDSRWCHWNFSLT